MEQNLTGKVKFFNKDKGYGFIKGEDGDYFVHISGVMGSGQLNTDDNVTFDLEANKRDTSKLCAVNVRIV